MYNYGDSQGKSVDKVVGELKKGSGQKGKICEICVICGSGFLWLRLAGMGAFVAKNRRWINVPARKK